MRGRYLERRANGEVAREGDYVEVNYRSLFRIPFNTYSTMIYFDQSNFVSKSELKSGSTASVILGR